MIKKPLSKILIVDDDIDIMQIIKYSLEEMKDIEIKYAFSGGEGIEKALQFLPDLMLIDVMMPEMSGIAMVEAMRLIPSLAKIPVVFLTAKMQKEEISHYHNMGVMDIITKPFDPIKLPDRILDIWSHL